MKIEKKGAGTRPPSGPHGATPYHKRPQRQIGAEQHCSKREKKEKSNFGTQTNREGKFGENKRLGTYIHPRATGELRGSWGRLGETKRGGGKFRRSVEGRKLRKGNSSVEGKGRENKDFTEGTGPIVPTI